MSKYTRKYRRQMEMQVVVDKAICNSSNLVVHKTLDILENHFGELRCKATRKAVYLKLLTDSIEGRREIE